MQQANRDLPVQADAPTRILASAERLFAERGVEATSIRMITEAAGVNVAAVSYHFGSKEGLVKELVKRRFNLLDEARCKLMEGAKDGPCDLRRAVEAFIGPMITLGLDQDGGRHFTRLAARFAWDPSFRLEEVFREQPPRSMRRFDELLRKALPAIADDFPARFWAVQFSIGAVNQAMMLISSEKALPPVPGTTERIARPEPERIRRMLVDYVVAGLEGFAQPYSEGPAR